MPPIQLGMEIPLLYLEALEPLVDIHFCIATHAAQYPQYLQYYKERATAYRRGTSKKVVMLDNGAHEAHSSREYEYQAVGELISIAEQIEPQIAWAPDKVHDREVTNTLVRDYVTACHDAPWEIGIIPQGRTAEEIARVIREMGRYYPDIAWLGLSFHNDRDAVMHLLGREIQRWRVHMLGISDFIEMRLWPRIPLSTDTSKPIKAAINGMEVVDCPRGLGLMPIDATTNNTKLMVENVQFVRRLCQE